jgi:uncharacterized tellurite resistance protein B-like protein
MAFGNIRNISNTLRFFGGSSANEDFQDELYGEVLMTTLAQASRADANIHPLEIESIKQIMQRETGRTLTGADIRKASVSDMYEAARFRRYLRRSQGKLSARNKARILQALVDVITSDTKINVLEIDFFNRVADALRITPAEQVGLNA